MQSGLRLRGRTRGRAVRPARSFTVVLVLCLAATGLVGVEWTGAPAAHAQEELRARGIERVCPAPESLEASELVAPPQLGQSDGDDGTVPAEADLPPFSDLDSTHGPAVVCAAAYGLVSGFTDGTFRPGAQITREQMATFVAAWLRVATGVPLPTPEELRFADIDGSVHRGAIEALATVDIVSGLDEQTFGPGQPLTRGQFARTVANAISYADLFTVDGPLPPAGDSGVLEDVVGTTFQEPIEALAGIGVAVGISPGVYAPDATVTRGQLTTFLLRAADYLDGLQRWKPTAVAPVLLEADLFALEPPAAPGEGDSGDDGEATDGEEGSGDGDGEATDGEEGSGDGDGEATDGDGAPDGGTVTPRIVGGVRVAIDPFGAVLAYEARILELVGSEATSGRLVLYRLDRSGLPVAVLEVIEELSPDGVVRTGEVFEAASRVRFADLLRSGETLLVRVTTTDRPEGVAQGVLRVPEE